MALMWTQASDVTDRWVDGTPPATEPQITTLLGDAEDTVLREFPDIETRIDGNPEEVSNPIPLARVQKVVARMVIRHLRNPSGLRSTQDGAGPFQKTQTFGGDEPGAMYLTDDDRAELGGGQSGRAFQVDMTPDLSGFTYNPLDQWQTPSG